MSKKQYQLMNFYDFEFNLQSLGGKSRVIDRKNAWRHMQDWREVFAAVYHETAGKWKLGDFEWHIFSFGYAPFITGDKAVYEYSQQIAAPFYLITEEAKGFPAYWVDEVPWPDLRSWLLDAYVSPEDLSWTMAFTHESESGLGPYFCRREWIITRPQGDEMA